MLMESPNATMLNGGGYEYADLAVDMTERLMSLPAVPTHNWCEIAADALTGAFHRCVVIVRISSPDGENWSPEGIACRPLSAAIADAVRRTVETTPDPRAEEAGEEGEIVMTTIELDPEVSSIDPLIDLLTNLGATRMHRAAITLNERRGVVLTVECVDTGGQPRRDNEAFEATLRAVIGLVARRARSAAEAEEGQAVEPLTIREYRVLEALTRGKTISEIADEMNRSTHTVRDYLKSMHRKIGVSTRSQLIARAIGRN